MATLSPSSMSPSMTYGILHSVGATPPRGVMIHSVQGLPMRPALGNRLGTPADHAD